jgi:cell fate regulator YaaT (PSP1 superfamily)
MSRSRRYGPGGRAEQRSRPPRDAESSGAPGAPPEDAGAGPDTPVVHVAFRGGRREGYVNSRNLVLRCGDFVVVEAERGMDLGRVTVCEGSLQPRRRKQPVRALVRHATEEEVGRGRMLIREDHEAYDICRDRVRHFNLGMKVIDAETQFDGNRLTFYFTADRRVDFRELVRDLASIFRTRIELRQVGARDAARRTDGMGPCGRGLCCTAFLRDFEPVTLKLAKEQNLPLNPAKISGSCGRLMCCMNYEARAYQAAQREAPRLGTRWNYQGQELRVSRLDIGNYRVWLEDAEGAAQSVDLSAFRGASPIRAGAEEEGPGPEPPPRATPIAEGDTGTPTG